MGEGGSGGGVRLWEREAMERPSLDRSLALSSGSGRKPEMGVVVGKLGRFGKTSHQYPHVTEKRFVSSVQIGRAHV